jgi:hypothetical protein
MTLAAVSMSTDFSYAPTNDQTVAVFIGFILFHGLLNTLNTAWLARITKVSPLGLYVLISVLRLLQHWLYVRRYYRIIRRPET